jgi:hypothetical protein
MNLGDADITVAISLHTGVCKMQHYIHMYLHTCTFFFSFDDCHMWQLMAGTGAQMIITPTILPPIIVHCRYYYSM